MGRPPQRRGQLPGLHTGLDSPRARWPSRGMASPLLTTCCPVAPFRTLCDPQQELGSRSAAHTSPPHAKKYNSATSQDWFLLLTSPYSPCASNLIVPARPPPGLRSPHPSGSKLLPSVDLRMHRTRPRRPPRRDGGWAARHFGPRVRGRGRQEAPERGWQGKMGKRYPYPPSSHHHACLGPSMAKPTWKPTGKGARGVCRGHPPRPGVGHRGDRRDHDGGKGKQPPQKSSSFLGPAASHKAQRIYDSLQKDFRLFLTMTPRTWCHYFLLRIS